MSIVTLLYMYLAALMPLFFAPLFNTPLLINTLSPLLIFLLYKRGFKSALIHSAFAGLTLDLLAVSTPLGFWTLCYCLSLISLSRFKQLFFIEKIFTLPTLTLFFSWISTTIYFILIHTFCSKTHLSVQWALTDLVTLPFGDGLYALLFFSLPYYFLSKFFKETSRRVASLNLKR